MVRTCAAATLALIATTREASAGELAERVDASYRLQVFIADAAGYAVTGVGVGLDNPVAFLGLTGFMLATPIIHASHGKRAASIGSLIMRITIPLVGAVAGPKFNEKSCASDPSPDCGEAEEERGQIIGIGVGMAFVTLLDVAWLSKKTVLRMKPGVFQPTVTRVSGATTFGVAGSF